MLKFYQTQDQFLSTRNIFIYFWLLLNLLLCEVYHARLSPSSQEIHHHRKKDDHKLKVFIIAGQSNALGYGSATGNSDSNFWLPTPIHVPTPTSSSSSLQQGTLSYIIENSEDIKKSFPECNHETRTQCRPKSFNYDAYIYNADENRVEFNDTTYHEKSYIVSPPNISTSGVSAIWAENGKLTIGKRFGPEIGFVQKLREELYTGDQKILIIKAAYEGTDLKNHWRTPLAVKNRGGEVGQTYKDFIEFVRSVLDESYLSDFIDGYDSMTGFEVLGFGFHQGWNDGLSKSYVCEYERNLRDLIVQVRQDLSIPDLPVSIPVSGHGGWDKGTLLRQYLVQSQYGSSYNFFHSLDNVAITETRGFVRHNADTDDGPCNQIYHYDCNAETFLYIGHEMAVGMLNFLKKQEWNQSSLCFGECCCNGICQQLYYPMFKYLEC